MGCRAFPRKKPAKRGQEVQAILPLPLDRPTFEVWSEKMKLPKSFLVILERATPTQESLDVADAEGDPHIGNGKLDSIVMSTLC